MNVGNFSITAPRMEEDEFRAERDNLSTEERERAECDLYGKERQLPKETDEFLDEKVSEFTVEIDRLSDKEAYSRAVELCPGYVQDRAFVLLFLRADFYDVKVCSSCVSFCEGSPAAGAVVPAPR